MNREEMSELVAIGTTAAFGIFFAGSLGRSLGKSIGEVLSIIPNSITDMYYRSAEKKLRKHLIKMDLMEEKLLKKKK